MLGIVKKAWNRSKGIVTGLAIGGGTALATMAPASAQFTPDTMDAIVFPITLDSIMIATVTAGAAVLVIVFAWKGGFKMVWKLLGRLLAAI